jgi:hypothetical protein
MAGFSRKGGIKEGKDRKVWRSQWELKEVKRGEDVKRGEEVKGSGGGQWRGGGQREWRRSKGVEGEREWRVNGRGGPKGVEEVKG